MSLESAAEETIWEAEESIYRLRLGGESHGSWDASLIGEEKPRIYK